MNYSTITIIEADATVQLSLFQDEAHAIIHVSPRGETFPSQLRRLDQAVRSLLGTATCDGFSIVFQRYFLSDAANQAHLIPHSDVCAISRIQQPPLDGSKVSAWLYLRRGAHVSREDSTTVVSRNGYRHLWTLDIADTTGDTSYDQTRRVLSDYSDTLARHGATLASNCVRTWFHVRDVDTQYSGLVKARNAHFETEGLTAATHYIASTGIGGIPPQPGALVLLGAYAVTPIAQGQQTYLQAPTHLNRTSDYGVAFERGTLLKFGDRNHIYISGTASINNQGEVMYPGDITRQTLRMWDNVDALLREGGMDFDDVMQTLVYLRDPADYQVVADLFDTRFPRTPRLITLAPVCRPAWLIEMECVAVRKAQNPYPAF